MPIQLYLGRCEPQNLQHMQHAESMFSKECRDQRCHNNRLVTFEGKARQSHIQGRVIAGQLQLSVKLPKSDFQSLHILPQGILSIPKMELFGLLWPSNRA